jgi:HK97 family phage prohead protease
MKLTMPLTITSADSETRTITGRVVTWNETGSTSAGLTTFKPESIPTKNVKLLLEHDRTRPIGKVLSMTATDQGIDATFKIAETNAGNDALIEAATGLRDGFSVGVKVSDHDFVDGVLTVAKGSLDEVSLVSEPAIDSARVSSVAASDTETEEETETTEKDSDSVDEETEEENPTTEGDKVPDTTEVATTETTVEASKYLQANKPVLYSQPRSPIINLGTFMEHSIKAKLNPLSDSAIYVAAANDDLGTTNPAFNPTRQLNEVINGLSNGTRGAIDAISRGALPDAGLQFEIPKISQIAVVDPVAEGGAVTNTGIESSFISVPVSRFAGRNILTTEIIDRSSPDFFNELVRIMASAMAFSQNKFVANQLVTDSVLDATPTANTAAGLIAYVSRANAAVYAGTQRFAENILVSPAQWSNIMGYNDNGTPLFNAYQPSNQAGQVNGQSQRGVVLGLNFFVDNSGEVTGTGDDSMLVIEPNSYTWYESGNFRLDVNKPSDGTVEVSLNSYGACATKIGAGANAFNFT